MKSDKPWRIVAVIAIVVVVTTLLAFPLGMRSGIRKDGAYRALSGLRNTIVDTVRTVEHDLPTALGTRPVWHLQPATGPGQGVTVNRTADGALVLIAGFFDDSNEIRLLTREGRIVRRWPVAFSAIFPDPQHVARPPATDWNVDLHGTLALPDGSVVFNFETAGLVRLGRCGEVLWTVARETHHSVVAAEAGGFWVPSRHYVEGSDGRDYPPFRKPYYEDTVLRVSDDGEILDEFSVVETLYDNGLAALLTATGERIRTDSDWDGEIVHLNKVAELSSANAAAFPVFSAGDLLLSIRKYNLLLVVEPATRAVKWWRIGPWLRQHDPEFESDGRISVFNNNTFLTSYAPGSNAYGRVDVNAARVSEILLVDPVSGAVERAWGNQPGQSMLTVIRGKHQSTAAGGWIITEHEGGRALEVDAGGDVAWEYVNRYDADEVAEITEALVYPQGYFSVSDWSCPGD